MPARIKLSEGSPTVLSLEDDVLECFFLEGSKRIHVIHIQGIELSTNRRGTHMLTVQLKHESMYMEVDEKPLAKVRELVDQVKQAISASDLR